MKKPISWTNRCEDGVKRDVRVAIVGRNIKWQFKRADAPRWDYDSDPTEADWDELESILTRRAGRGRAVTKLEQVRKHRAANETG